MVKEYFKVKTIWSEIYNLYTYIYSWVIYHCFLLYLTLLLKLFM